MRATTHAYDGHLHTRSTNSLSRRKELLAKELTSWDQLSLFPYSAVGPDFSARETYDSPVGMPRLVLSANSIRPNADAGSHGIDTDAALLRASVRAGMFVFIALRHACVVPGGLLAFVIVFFWISCAACLFTGVHSTRTPAPAQSHPLAYALAHAHRHTDTHTTLSAHAQAHTNTHTHTHTNIQPSRASLPGSTTQRSAISRPPFLRFPLSRPHPLRFVRGFLFDGGFDSIANRSFSIGSTQFWVHAVQFSCFNPGSSLYIDAV